ncbi:MAG TPA: LON peptidase substrate-binding domain-containing protein [Eoetvoesiella sp.]
MMSIPLFPLSKPLFPAGVLTLRIFEVRYLDMVKKCIAEHTEFGVVALLSGGEVRTPEGHEELAMAGTMARLDEWSSPMPGLMHLRCTGTTRFTLASAEQGKYGLWVGQADPIADDPVAAIPVAQQVVANKLGTLIAELQKDGVPADQMPIAAPFRLDECGWVANRWSEILPMPTQQKLHLLTLPDPVRRLEHVQQYLIDRGLMS